MLDKLKDQLNQSRKAIIAVAAPIAVHFVNEVTLEAGKQATGILAVIAAGIGVWLTRNKPAEG